MTDEALTRRQRWVLRGLIVAWVGLFYTAWAIWPHWWLVIPFTIIGIIGSTIFTRRISR